MAVNEKLVALAKEQKVLVCQIPIAHGPLKGQSAQGTRTGYTRHRMAGQKGDEICKPCRDFHAAYVKNWLGQKKVAEADRRVHARLGDGAQVVRYAKAGKWFLERGENRQVIKVDDAVKLVMTDHEAEHYSGVPGGEIFDRKIEKA